MIHYDLNTIFVEIPKNGSNSVRQTLCNDPYEKSGHETYSMMKWEIETNGYNIDDFYTFAISRNPYDRYCSVINFMINVSRMPFDFDSTLDFIDSLIARSTGEPMTGLDADGNRVASPLQDGLLQYWWQAAWPMIVPQHAFIEEDGVVMVDNIYKLEEIDTHWPTIASTINNLSGGSVSTTLVDINSQENLPDWTSYFEGTLGETRKQRIDSIYSRDFELFGYEKVIP